MKMRTRNIGAPLLFAMTIGLTAMSSHAQEPPSKPYTITGHIDLVSRYYLRGVTNTYGNVKPGPGNEFADAPESDKAALQWGVDFSHESGWYLGYWASQINYSYEQLGKSYDDRSIVSGFQSDKSIENDLYGGYVGKAGDWSYTLGLTGYVYYNGEHADALETKLGISYKQFGFYAQTLLNDTVWGNEGDTYVTLTYTQPLPYDITFNASLGWYVYEKEGKYLGVTDTLTGTACAADQAFNINGCYAGNRPISDDFRHLILGVSQPIGKSGFVWAINGLIAGKNRFGIEQDDKIFGSISYTF